MALANTGTGNVALTNYNGSLQLGTIAVTGNLSVSTTTAGNISQATRNYEHSVELQPSPVGYLLLAQALEIGGHAEAALAAHSEAGRLAPDLGDDIVAMKQLLGN